MDPNRRKRLKPSAVPRSYIDEPSTSQSTSTSFRAPESFLPLKVRTPKKTYVKSNTSLPSSSLMMFEHETEERSSPDRNFLQAIVDMPSPKSKRKLRFDEHTPRKAKMARVIKDQKQIIKNKRSQLSKLRANIKRTKESGTVDNLLETFNFPSVHSKALAGMQFKNTKRKWTLEERNLSIMIFYKSPSTYEFLRRQKITLPGISSIRRWIGSSKFKPGFCKKYLQQIKLKFEEKTVNERAAVLCFDEMSIMECLEYSKAMDMIEGFEDLGNMGRTRLTAQYALVFLVRGLYNSWKLPIAYFLTHTGVKADDLAMLIKQTLEKLFEANLIPKITVCDQGSNNRSALAVLGVNVEEPFFKVGGKLIFSIYDVPHIFKNMKTNLETGDYILNGKIISFKDIEAVYNIDKTNKISRALPKLTDSHIYTKTFKKMNVKLSVQVLSHSVAAAIRTCVQTKELLSDSATNTADFVDLMDKLFDCLNSKTLFAKNPYRSALSDNNTYVMDTLQKATDILSNLTKISTTNKKISRPYCFDGLLLTIRGILMLFEEEKKHGTQYILTNRLNQDVLENQFSIYRQKGGYNRNPTARTLRTIFRSNAVHSLMTPSAASNCEPDIDIMASVPISDNVVLTFESDASSTSTSTPDTDADIEETLEDCSLTYFAGYLAQKCINEFKCEVCINYLRSAIELTDKKQLLIINKLYDNISSGGLIAPSSNFRKIIHVSIQCLEKHYDVLFYKNNVAKNLGKKIKNKILKLDSLWFTHENCSEHRAYIIEKLIHCKLFKKCKWFGTKNKVSTKINPKLRILKHT